MEALSWELSVLHRAVAYGNLSGAAVHIGLSQPQLSRIVGRLEADLGVLLLDRGARRKSGWTPAAHRLAQVYAKTQRSFQRDLQEIVHATHPLHIKVGTLEGLIPLATAFCQHLLKETPVQIIELDVHDLNRLEELYIQSESELIFTSREPGRKKNRYSRLLGYQSLDLVERGSTEVLSLFEFGRTLRAHNKSKAKTLVSNSLEVRRTWLKDYGGKGILPSVVRKHRASKAELGVYLLALDVFPATLWECLEAFKVTI